jgi:hypothetical protein
LSERIVPRAPAADGAVVAEPHLRDAGAVLALNRRRFHDHAAGHGLLGCPWADLRRHARQDAVAAAIEYLGEDPGTGSRKPKADALLVAGHQPELFHPGVWVKNFALYGLARAHGATPLNLVVDNDSVKTTALRIPTLPLTPNPSPPKRGRGEKDAPLLPRPPEGGEGLGVRGAEDRPHLRSVLFDRWTGEAPYEERAIADRELFATFAERAGEMLRAWGFEPMLPAFWTEVLRQAERTPILGECFAAARRTFERDWGCHNLEVPLSAVCRTEAFAWFACDLLARLPDFRDLYNAVVADYRLRNGIRSHNHPVPDLAAEGDWLEAPLWGWRTGARRRGRLFARTRDDRLELRASDDIWPTLPLPREGRAEAAVQAWRDLERQGFKVRSRALTTTLYARLFLADLFIHGIGGGKYDELTDELIRRFYGCEPPVYVVLSATRWLPLPRTAVTAEDRRRLVRAIRDVHYNPQRYLSEADDGKALADLAARKAEWTARQPATLWERRERFRVLQALTDELRRPLHAREEQLRRELALCERQLRANAVLQRRDYSFCLFPTDSLRSFCTQFLQPPDWC